MRAQEIFVGPIGLRSGWRLLIFLAIVIAFEAAFQEVVVLILKARGIVEPEGLYAMVFLVGDAITLIAVVIATWIMARWEHRKLSSYGLPGKNAFGRRFWEGAVFGYAGVSALILLIFLAGGYSAGSLALHGAALRRATLLWLLASDRLLTATFHGADWLTGGKLGPEASLFVFPVIAAMFLAFHVLYRAPSETFGQSSPVLSSVTKQ